MRSIIRVPVLGLALLVVTTSLAYAGERDRMKLQQPLVPAPKLYCHSADCMSLSTHGPGLRRVLAHLRGALRGTL
jgi:hypothetical protein